MRRLLLAAALVVAVTGCGSDDPQDTVATEPQPTAASPAACASTPPGSQSAVGSTDLTKKPEIEVPDTPPPCDLVVVDLVKGSGATAVTGKQITVKYVGVTYADGKEFDASWGGDDFTFTLGAGRVIAGWDTGFTGMQEGGRRQLVIPPKLGYGETGAGPIAPNSTLIFVVDLVKVG